jgi:hypothetical protein
MRNAATAYFNTRSEIGRFLISRACIWQKTMSGSKAVQFELRTIYYHASTTAVFTVCSEMTIVQGIQQCFGFLIDYWKFMDFIQAVLRCTWRCAHSHSSYKYIRIELDADGMPQPQRHFNAQSEIGRFRELASGKRQCLDPKLYSSNLEISG